MKTLPQISIALLLLATGFLVGRSLRPKCSAIKTRTDTVFVRDTIRDTILIPQTRYVVRTDTVRVQIAGDTVFIDAQIPIERKEYQTDDYRAVIEGFRPELIAMEVFRQTRIVTQTQTVKVPAARRWGIGIQVGYGASISNARFVATPYIGVGIQCSIFTW